MAPIRKKSKLKMNEMLLVTHKGGKRSTSKVKFSDDNFTNASAQVTANRSQILDIKITEESLVLPESSTGNTTTINNQSVSNNKENNYYKYVMRDLQNWTNERENMLKQILVREMPLAKTCQICGKEGIACTRCADCSPFYIACKPCAVQDHRLRPFHILETWMEDHFEDVRKEGITEIQMPTHERCKYYLHRLIVIDSKGRPHEAYLRVCSCETICAQIARLGFWPCSPTNPSMVLDLDFMRLMRAFLLETQTSTRAFIKAHRLVNFLSIYEINQIYRAVVGTPVDEFLHMCSKYLALLRPPDSLLNRCPACPESRPVVSMDANFGLVRKISSGKSFQNFKHPARFFVPREEIEKFRDEYNDTTQTQQSCSTFKAGERMRSKNKSGKLDVTGVFGAVCRHEVPLLFLDMSEGERLLYPVFLLKKLLEEFRGVNVTYDIACKLETHLQRHDPQLRKELILAVPIFHCYGHKRWCQIRYNPRRVRGFGYCDGEAIERLWAFLRKFTPITKEMTQIHRITVLNEALWHYRVKKIEKLPMLIAQGHRDAGITECMIQEDIDECCRKFNVVYTPREIEKWIRMEELHAKHQEREVQPSTWHETYVGILLDLQNANEKMESLDKEDGERQSTQRQIQTLEKRACRIEQLRKISRYESDDDTFIRTKQTVMYKKRRSLLLDMLQLSRERVFLCYTKNKYPEGQSIVNRMSAQINNVVRKITQLMEEYNNITEQTLILADVFDPESQCYEHFEQLSETELPTSVRANILDLHFRKLAIIEERQMIEKDAQQMCDSAKMHIDYLLGLCLSNENEPVKAVICNKIIQLTSNYELMCNMLRNIPNVSPKALEKQASTTTHILVATDLEDLLTSVDDILHDEFQNDSEES